MAKKKTTTAASLAPTVKNHEENGEKGEKISFSGKSVADKVETATKAARVAAGKTEAASAFIERKNSALAPAAAPTDEPAGSLRPASADGVKTRQGSGSGGTAETPAAPAGEGFRFTEPAAPAFDPGDEYRAAMESLRRASAGAGDYASPYADELESLYAQIAGRGAFDYDLEGDALWQQYRRRYTELGRRAMLDTQGQAAALTGGYGSSYAQSVGQQQYGEYMQALGELAPELYDRAYARWQDEGAALEGQYDRLTALEDTAYDRWRDAVSDAARASETARKEADTAYDRAEADYEREYRAYKDASAARKERRERLIKLISTTGYVPTEAELAAAGLDRAEAEAWRGK